MSNSEILKYINQRLSLRSPQKKSLEILDDILSTVKLSKDADIQAQLAAVHEKYSDTKGFDREFMNICFALATGVGKTRLMGAFISYLHKAHNINNFMIISPNLTVYNKLVTDFTPGTPKYVFKGIDVFHQNPPVIVTGENYQNGYGIMEDALFKSVVINVFNISKLYEKASKKPGNDDPNAGVPLIRRLRETLGESYFDYLSSRPDMVMLMDEAHHYRGENEGYRAINALKPILGLELTATPRVIKNNREVLFKNIVYAYSLASAMKDGFVKEPAVATRKNFDPDNYSKDSVELERLKLNDGIFLHEQTKVALEAYAFNNNKPQVKPFMLVVAEDKAHADELENYLVSSEFKGGAYADKVIKVYSGKSEAGDEAVKQLLEIEKPGNPVEIVIHVNKLSEGWDVTNLYTIVPLRAANSVNLVEQSIGRGLRLPYGQRTGVAEVDTVTVVSHDNYAKIIKAAKDGKLQMLKEYIIGDEKTPEEGKKPIIITPTADKETSPAVPESEKPETGDVSTDNSGSVANIVPENTPENTAASQLKNAADEAVSNGKVQTLQETAAQLITENPETKEKIEAAVETLQALTIEIPRIFLEKPKQAVVKYYAQFQLDIAKMPKFAVDDRLQITTIRTGKKRAFDPKSEQPDLPLARQILLSRIVAFDDIDYDENADLIQTLVDECIAHLQKQHGDSIACNLLRNDAEIIANDIHKQIEAHAVYDDVEYGVKVCSGYFKLMPHCATINKNETPRDYRIALPAGEKSRIKSMVFTGFSKCLYDMQKFDSDSEREFSRVLEDSNEVVKWFKPALSSFVITWMQGNYQPDFIVETNDAKYICEVKADNELEDTEVVGKMEAAILWSKRASEGDKKPWYYLLVPHSKITENLDFSGAKTKYRKN